MPPIPGLITTEGIRYLIVITDKNSVVRRISDRANTRVDFVEFSPVLAKYPQIINKMPLFYEDEFHIPDLTLEILGTLNDYTYYIDSEYIIGASVKIYIVDEDTVSLSDTYCIFRGVVKDSRLKDLCKEATTADKTSLLFSLNISPGYEAWQKRYPDTVIKTQTARLIKDTPVVQEISESAIPIIYGDYRESSGAWAKAVGDLYESEDEIKYPILLSDMNEIRITEVETSSPDLCGEIKRTLAGVVALKGYGEANTTYGVVSIKNKYGKAYWYLTPFECIEKRTETSNQQFPDEYTIEVGNMHNPAWHVFNSFAGKMLCIDSSKSWEYRALLSGFDYKKFYFVWFDDAIDRICCSAMDNTGRLSLDGSTIYPSVGYFKNLKKTDGNEFSASLSTCTVWKKGFLWQHEDGKHYVGTWILFTAGISDVDYALAAFNNQSGDFKMIKVGNFGTAHKELFYADGDDESFDVGSSGNYINALLYYKNTTGNTILSYDYQTSSFYAVVVTADEQGACSMIGCCAFAKGDEDYELTGLDTPGRLYENDPQRMQFFAVQKGTDDLKFKQINWSAILGRNVGLLQSVDTDGMTLEVMGCIAYQRTLPDVRARYIAFVNDTADGQSYLVFYAYHESLSAYQGVYTELPFSNIYDVQIVTRDYGESTVIVATSDGVFHADAYELFFKDDALVETYEYITDLGESFQKFTDKIMNTVSIAKYRLMKGIPPSNYITGMSREDSQLVCKWKGTDEEDDKLAFSSLADSIDDIGIYGQITHGSTELTTWERNAMWLLHRAEGKTSYVLGSGNCPDTVDWTSWGTAYTARGAAGIVGNCRFETNQRYSVLTHAWKILKQCGHYVYHDTTDGKLHLKHAFTALSGEPDLILTRQNAELKECSLYEGYVNELAVKFNKLRGDYFSYFMASLPDVLGKENRRSLDMDIYIDSDYLYSGIDALGYITLLLAHESNWNYLTETAGNPLKIVEFTIPAMIARPIKLASWVQVSDEFACPGEYVLFQKKTDRAFETWTMLQKGVLFLPEEEEER